MNKEDLIENVNGIISVGDDDDEAAHSMEDRLHLEIIEAFCPTWVIEEVNRLNNADFSRWCA